MCIDILYCTDNIAEFSDTGRLDKDTVRSVISEDLFKSLSEIAYQRAAYTAGIHFCYLNAGILEKASVYTYLTEFVLDENKFFSLVTLGYQFFDKSSLTGTEKA